MPVKSRKGLDARAGSDDRLPIGVANGRIGGHHLLSPVLPNIEIVASLDPVLLGGAGYLDGRGRGCASWPIKPASTSANAGNTSVR